MEQPNVTISITTLPATSAQDEYHSSTAKQTPRESTDHTAPGANAANATILSPIKQEEATQPEANKPTTPETSLAIIIDLDKTTPTLETMTKPHQTAVTSPKLDTTKFLGPENKHSEAAKRKTSSPMHSPPPAKHAETIHHNTRPLRSGQLSNLVGERIIQR